MALILAGYKREALNLVINVFWTILCFLPILWFWITEGIGTKFYFLLGFSFVPALLPEKILNIFTLSPSRKFYEKIGVKQIRRFVQNGDVVNALTTKEKHAAIDNLSRAKQYLKTISMYERFHWVCFIFFLLTAILCFYNKRLELGFMVTVANLLFNVSSILLQQYNKIRIRNLAG